MAHMAGVDSVDEIPAEKGDAEQNLDDAQADASSLLERIATGKAKTSSHTAQQLFDLEKTLTARHRHRMAVHNAKRKGVMNALESLRKKLEGAAASSLVQKKDVGDEDGAG